MTESNVIALKDPVNIRDPLTELLRSGAKKLLHDAVEAELTEMLSGYAEHRDSSGRLQIVRNGHLPEYRTDGNRRRGSQSPSCS
jgi:putative transposase